ncbi:MAG: tetratricopeptide repeat protein, partial [Verrucomicrobiae bacterium]|nr:tetratricopeptide repeat protein [Verrucomicrobiae bacterium]
DPRISEGIDLELLWIQHGKKIIAAVVAVGVVMVGTTLWRRYSEEQAATAAARLVAARDVGALEQILTDYPHQEVAAQALLKLADRFFHSGQFELAAQRYRQFLEQFPSHPLVGAARLGLAAVAEAQGNFESALQQYQQLRGGDSKGFVTLPAILGMARCLEGLGRTEEARQRYEEAVAVGQGSPAQMAAYVRWLVLSRQAPPSAPPSTDQAGRSQKIPVTDTEADRDAMR